MLECVVAARQLWCWLQHWRYDLGGPMKCVCKVSIYHPPKNQHTIMILHNCSLPWILRRSSPQGSENMNTLWQSLAYNQSDSYVRMVFEKCMDQLQNTLSYLSITSVIWRLHLSPGTCSLELVISLIWLVPRNILRTTRHIITFLLMNMPRRASHDSIHEARLGVNKVEAVDNFSALNRFALECSLF